MRYAALLRVEAKHKRCQIGFPDFHETPYVGYPAYFEGFPPLRGIESLIESDSLIEPFALAVQFLMQDHARKIRAGEDVPSPGKLVDVPPPMGCALIATPMIRFTLSSGVLRPEVGEYVLEFVDLPQVISTGATIEEVLDNAEHEARIFATEVRGSGESIPKPSDW